MIDWFPFVLPVKKLVSFCGVNVSLSRSVTSECILNNDGWKTNGASERHAGEDETVFPTFVSFAPPSGS